METNNDSPTLRDAIVAYLDLTVGRSCDDDFVTHVVVDVAALIDEIVDVELDLTDDYPFNF